MTRPDAWKISWADGVKKRSEKTLARLGFFKVVRRVGPAYKKVKKFEKTFEKGIALFGKIEYNAEDVCKGDEVTDCSPASEGTAMDHVRQSDDGSRTVMQGNSQASRT